MIFRAKKNNWPLITEEIYGDHIAKEVNWKFVDVGTPGIENKHRCIQSIRNSFLSLGLNYDSFLNAKVPVKQIFKAYREAYKKAYGRDL